MLLFLKGDREMDNVGMILKKFCWLTITSCISFFLFSSTGLNDYVIYEGAKELASASRLIALIICQHVRTQPLSHFIERHSSSILFKYILYVPTMLEQMLRARYQSLGFGINH